MKSKILIATVFAVSLLNKSNVQAASFTDNQKVDPNKAWTVKFNNEVVLDDLTKQGITVKDKKGTKVNVGIHLGEDRKTVIVAAPEGGYIPEENYTLNLGDRVHSNSGKVLKNEYQLRFSIQETNGKTLNKNFETKIKSENLSTDYKVEQALSDVEKLGLNTLNIPVVIRIDNLTSSSMTIDKNSEERAISLIKQLQGPYPWINNGSEPETK